MCSCPDLSVLPSRIGVYWRHDLSVGNAPLDVFLVLTWLTTSSLLVMIWQSGDLAEREQGVLACQVKVDRWVFNRPLKLLHLFMICQCLSRVISREFVLTWQGARSLYRHEMSRGCASFLKAMVLTWQEHSTLPSLQMP